MKGISSDRLRLYVAAYPGVYLGALALVWAPDEHQARQLVIAQARENEQIIPVDWGIDLTELNVPDRPFANVIWDGDY